MASYERMRAVAVRVAQDIAAGQQPIVVASAMGGRTDALVDMAAEFSNTRGVAYDMLLASGEQVSVALLSMALREQGVDAQPLLAHQVVVQTDAQDSKARIQHIDTKKIKHLVSQKRVPVVAGFQGVTREGQLTTLGRGGSDTTAVAIAAAMGLKECEIYTDVKAVCTADPRLISKARPIKKLSFEEMMEMAFLGSRVLHFRCIEIAAKYDVRIHLRSTFVPDEGTMIQKNIEAPVVTALSHDANTCVFKLQPIVNETSFLYDLFEQLAAASVVVDIISHNVQQQAWLAFSVDGHDQARAEDVVAKVLRQYKLKTKINIMSDKVKLSAVGVGMKHHPGVAARVFKHLKNIDVHLVTTSDIKISVIIDQKHLQYVAQCLHNEFELA